jgi:small GTP-binding protein
MRTAKLKVCLVGEEAVGKTSLVQQFVHRVYDERYIRTVGTMVSKKTVDLDLDGQVFRADLMIWDIMGRRDFMQLFKDAYFSRVRGVVAVLDLTRPETLHALHEWLDGIRASVGNVPVIVLANKVDLRDSLAVTDEDIATLCKAYGAPFLKTSAKTGERVDAAFERLARVVLSQWDLAA